METIGIAFVAVMITLATLGTAYAGHGGGGGHASGSQGSSANSTIPVHGQGSSHNPIVYHPVHGPGSSHNPIVSSGGSSTVVRDHRHPGYGHGGTCRFGCTGSAEGGVVVTAGSGRNQIVVPTKPAPGAGSFGGTVHDHRGR
jgi:hypothetical protein